MLAHTEKTVLLKQWNTNMLQNVHEYKKTKTLLGSVYTFYMYGARAHDLQVSTDYESDALPTSLH